MSEKYIEEGLTFDDLLLVPSFSEVMPSEVEVSTYITPAIKLNIPLISAAMDTVTEAKTAICMAQEGGIGIIHRNMGVEAQAQEVEQVKKSESGMIVDPIVISPDQQIKDVLELMARYRISGIPVTRGRKLVGIITNRDLRFETNLGAEGRGRDDQGEPRHRRRGDRPRRVEEGAPPRTRSRSSSWSTRSTT